MNKIEIINAALRLIARNTISGLTDNSAEARIASALYDVVYEETLSGYPWSFAKSTTAQLSASPSETPDEKEVYPLPANWLMLTKVYEGETGTEQPYELKGNSLMMEYDVTDSGLYVDYTVKPDEGLLPPYFTPYLVKSLAANFAMPLTESGTLADSWATKAAAARSEAKYTDAISSGTKRLADDNEYTIISGR